ncbi:MAG: hypothetical protein ACREMK_10895 [Gemmatimonadota bacterium]
MTAGRPDALFAAGNAVLASSPADILIDDATNSHAGSFEDLTPPIAASRELSTLLTFEAEPAVQAA